MRAVANNIPEDFSPPPSAAAPDRALSLRTKQYETRFVRDVDILAVGWGSDPESPLSYLVFDPRADEDRRIFWISGDYVQQIRHA
jgi:hypothetical protein